jgi:hypothetical protein
MHAGNVSYSRFEARPDKDNTRSYLKNKLKAKLLQHPSSKHEALSSIPKTKKTKRKKETKYSLFSSFFIFLVYCVL